MGVLKTRSFAFQDQSTTFQRRLANITTPGTIKNQVEINDNAFEAVTVIVIVICCIAMIAILTKYLCYKKHYIQIPEFVQQISGTESGTENSIQPDRETEEKNTTKTLEMVDISLSETDESGCER